MTIAELRAVINNCDIDSKEKVRIKMVVPPMPNGGIVKADIKSFLTYSDMLILNVEIK